MTSHTTQQLVSSVPQAVSEDMEQWKIVDHAVLERKEIDYFLHALKRMYGPMVKSVRAIEENDLTNTKICCNAVMTQEEPQEEEEEALFAKQRVQSCHLSLRQWWSNQDLDDDAGLLENSRTWFRLWPRPSQAGLSQCPLWTRVYNEMSNDEMRVKRNYFAHSFGLETSAFDLDMEIHMFRWIHEKYTSLLSAVKPLMEKLQAALDDSDHWADARSKVHCQEDPKEMAEYATDLGDLEQNWATFYKSRQSLRIQEVCEEQNIFGFEQMPFKMFRLHFRSPDDWFEESLSNIEAEDEFGWDKGTSSSTCVDGTSSETSVKDASVERTPDSAWIEYISESTSSENTAECAWDKDTSICAWVVDIPACSTTDGHSVLQDAWA